MHRYGIVPFTDLPRSASLADPSTRKSRRAAAAAAAAATGSSTTSLLAMNPVQDQYDYKLQPTTLRLGADGRSEYSYPDESAIAIPPPLPAIPMKRADVEGVRIVIGPPFGGVPANESATEMSELPPLHQNRS